MCEWQAGCCLEAATHTSKGIILCHLEWGDESLLTNTCEPNRRSISKDWYHQCMEEVAPVGEVQSSDGIPHDG